jgi:cellulose synthase/poly-beta-1,6-N-acetylglucosamine synthase-like glycosyltransferase
VNNVSGAFGVFRTDLLRQVGGWNTGTAEDLDLTIRLKQYFHRFPGLRIRFEATAIGHTDAPVSLRQFLRQRLRWDGDLFHTYFRTHGNAFSPDLVGWPNFIALVWCGLLWQVVLPFLIFATTIVSFDRFPMGFLAFILVLYCYYIIVMSVQFGIYIALISERKREDLMFWPVVAMLPFYGFMMRIWSVVALLDGAFLNGHLDSNMAPYWVLKMGRH